MFWPNKKKFDFLRVSYDSRSSQKMALKLLLQLLDISNLYHHTQATKPEEGVDQGLGGFATDVGFLSFDVLLHFFIRQAFDLLMGELHTDGLFSLAGRNKDGQLFTFGGNVVAWCYETTQPCWRVGVGCGFQHLHHFVHNGVRCFSHGI